jgi:hypothetical protein
MTRVRTFFVACLVLGSIQAAQAQYPSPALSPWLNLGRRDPGPVGPYLSYVRPQQRLERTLSGQSASLQQQQASIQTLRTDLSQMQWAPARATGTGSVFMNHSHFYPGFSTPHRQGGTRGGYRVPSGRTGGYRGY